jgi:hypothetical protein
VSGESKENVVERRSPHSGIEQADAAGAEFGEDEL